MVNLFDHFEAATRRSVKMAAPPLTSLKNDDAVHPFDQRNIHPALPAKVKELFDDGHCAEATFAAFKFVDKSVSKIAVIKDSGFNLMMAAFNESSPKIKLNPLVEISEVDEQKGYRFVFAGAMQAIRNPRGHEVSLPDDPDQCLDHLSFASILLRRIEQAGYKIV